MDSIDAAFTRDFNTAHKLFADDRIQECAASLREMLADTAIPRYHRMKCLILLASCASNDDEALGYYKDAEVLWRIVRAWHPVGENEMVDKAMDELRVALDNDRKVLDEQKPKPAGEGENIESAVEREVAEHAARVMKQKEVLEEKEGSVEEQLEADALALGKTTEELRRLDVRKAHGPLPNMQKPNDDAVMEKKVNDPLSLAALKSSMLSPSPMGPPYGGRSGRHAENRKKASWRRES